jgi:AraC-like DNA-binding protein
MENMEKLYCEDTSKLPATTGRMAKSPIHFCSFSQIVEQYGTKDGLFYVIESAEIRSNLSNIPFKTDDAELIYVHRGELTIRHDMNAYTLPAGALLIKARNAIVQHLHLTDDCRFTIFGFTAQLATGMGAPLKQLEALMVLASRCPVVLLEKAGSLAVAALLSLMMEKSRLREKPMLYDLSVRHAFSLLILEIVASVRQEDANPSVAFGRREHLTNQFLDLLRDRIREHRHVNYYAGILYVTPKYLSQSVKEVTGKTSGEIIDEMVVAEAKALLGNPSITVGNVADELNFSDQFFFSKYFKRQTGMSPLSYRTVV